MAQYILLDTETTGGGEEDRICQLGYFLLDGSSCQVHEDFCKPPLPISFGAMSVHGITNEFIEDKPPYEDVKSAHLLNDLNRLENIMIIHNAPFDLGMLKKEGFVWKGQLIDTLRCVRHLLPDLESHALQYLRYALGFYKTEKMEADKLGVTINAHDAIGDVLILKMLTSHLVGLVNRDMNELVRLTQTPILIKNFRFGKYKDQPIAEVASKDRGYIEWMLREMKDMDDDLRFTLTQAIGG